MNQDKKDELIYENQFYKVVKRFSNGSLYAKEVWTCKGCSKEFKQHTRFQKHNIEHRYNKREAQAERMKCKNCHGKNIQLCQETETKRFYQCQDCFTEIRVRK